MEGILDIPKLYTALSEWCACLVFVLILEKRLTRLKTALILCALLASLSVLQHYIGIWPVAFWIPGMIGASLLMYAAIYACCKIDFAEAGVTWAMAFLLAEFNAALEWQIYSFFLGKGGEQLWLRTGCLVLFYGAVFTGAYWLEKRYLQGYQRSRITLRETVSSLLIAVAVFLMSNISYVYEDTPFSASMSGGLFYVRTLVDFAGVVILLSMQDRWRELGLSRELDITNTILQRQYEQYQLSKENAELINRKYHDLKHQIGIIRAEQSSEKKEAYLKELEEDIRMYEAQNKTGNSVLDTILTGKSLYCVQHGINLTCVADGRMLGFMSTMDICTIFGNALDNAIEAQEKIADLQKRIVKVAVYAQNSFLVIRVENYCEEQLRESEMLPGTTKRDKEYHGFGLKSMKITAERYGGTMTFHLKDGWFTLRFLIPLPSEKAE